MAAARQSLAPGDDDLQNPKISAAALDFLLIELVPLAQRITEQLHAREQTLQAEYNRSRAIASSVKPVPPDVPAKEENGSNTTLSAHAGAKTNGSVKGSVTGTVGDETATVTSLGFPAMSEETREGVFFRLDGLGYRVGQGLVERFSANKPRASTPLEAIKFICKDLWILVFRKQIDNLKTNHRGVFVLTDNRFQPLGRMSVDRRAGPRASEDALARAQSYLYFPCGLIRGALASLGVEATVEAVSSDIPTATFHIKTKGSKP
ncbi:TRS33-TRAPP subunit of 33 kDa involved in targeting and fusion of ER to golgi transp [Acrodontium crateriforme]|uniref:TRS33-TRAPP subunit of 33 kDa involved in targeting and fusion of ER to golgi transp n=1 Tax=Acrodontium crateriforme TaxID=150365 RepID=A0AAQ3RAH3_9PEZI|nr:TRS33-TRAPP subunit of 33 kDa involved in targeting and fusion of ER to golgi transp [Acrodontium crateriforme]